MERWGRLLEGEKLVDLPPSNLHFGVEPSRFVAYPTNDRSRRILRIPVGPGERPFTEPTKAIRRGNETDARLSHRRRSVPMRHMGPRLRRDDNRSA